MNGTTGIMQDQKNWCGYFQNGNWIGVVRIVRKPSRMTIRREEAVRSWSSKMLGVC